MPQCGNPFHSHLLLPKQTLLTALSITGFSIFNYKIFVKL